MTTHTDGTETPPFRTGRPASGAARGTRRRPRAAAQNGQPPTDQPVAVDLPPLGGVRGQAAAAGALAARRRQYDEWSFGGTIAYLEGLRRRRDQAIAENAAGAWAGAQRIRDEILRRGREEHASAELTAETVASARRDRDLARRREEITLDGLDILAGAWAPRHRPGWDDVDPAAEGEDATAANRDAPSGRRDPGAFPDADEIIIEGRAPTVPGGEASDADEGDRAEAESARSGRRLRWMGAADGRATAMPLPTRLKLFILAALVLAEIPIYFISFQHFHPRDDFIAIAQTALLSGPIALVMVVAPHLAGKQFRQRHELPVERFLPHLVVATVMVLWFAGAVLFGWLRQAVLLAPVTDPETGQNVGGLTDINANWQTMTVVFAVVLLLSGLIAFLLGVAQEHPAIAAFRAAVQDRREKDDAYLRAVAAQAQTLESTIVPEEEQLDAHWREAEERERAIWEEHQAAQCDYLDAVSLGMGQPTLTEATAAAIRQESPPDPPYVRQVADRGYAGGRGG
jgi:hypothetical protein